MPLSSPNTRARLGGKAWHVIIGHWSRQIVGMVPPSMTYSLPVIDAARSDARKATSSATSAGQPGRPSGMPPSDLINCARAVFRSVLASAASRSIRAVAASVSMKPGATLMTRTPCDERSRRSGFASHCHSDRRHHLLRFGDQVPGSMGSKGDQMVTTRGAAYRASLEARYRLK
jgi:hypothetical protein